MGSAVGLWIDHRKAVIVTVSDQAAITSYIDSGVDKQPGRIGGIRSLTPFEAQLVPADDRQENRFQGHLATYYDKVIAALHGADRIFIFGPGEAKGELKRRLENANRGGHIVGFESADRMTDRQIAAKVSDGIAAALCVGEAP